MLIVIQGVLYLTIGDISNLAAISKFRTYCFERNYLVNYVLQETVRLYDDLFMSVYDVMRNEMYLNLVKCGYR